MADPIWLVGPAGNMQPLVCPEKDIDITPVRYGGVFQGLSGARSMTVTGHKQRFTFQFRFLTEDEWGWLEALHFRTLFGPYRLRNPMKANLLSPTASLVRTTVDSRTVQFTSGVASSVLDWPSAAGTLGGYGTKWTNRSSGTQVFRVEDRFRVPVVVGAPVVFSLYVKASTSMSGSIIIDWYNNLGAQIGSSSPASTALTTSWARFSVTGIPPAGAVTARAAWYSATTAPDVTFAAAQFEDGTVPTAWKLGGGAPVILVDQLEVATPRFPYRNTTLSLLEA